jgi:EAL domain-containing protein (putative c-di-GMP-specific phosphodiesterase class I)
VVLTLVRLAGSLNMAVIAEGVETKEQLEMLSRFGCDEAQGFYFARPMPLGELKDFLRMNQEVLENEPDPYAT